MHFLRKIISKFKLLVNLGFQERYTFTNLCVVIYYCNTNLYISTVSKKLSIKIDYTPVKYFYQILPHHPLLFSCEPPGDSTCLINQKSDKKIYENFSLALCQTQFIYFSLLRLNVYSFTSIYLYYKHTIYCNNTDYGSFLIAFLRCTTYFHDDTHLECNQV